MDAENFKRWRIERGWTQQQAAAALGVTYITIQSYERGAHGDGRPARIPRAIALACAALAAGLSPISG